MELRAAFERGKVRATPIYVNRSESFTPRTLPELYSECEELIRRLGRTLTVTFDERGILRSSCFQSDGWSSELEYD